LKPDLLEFLKQRLLYLFILLSCYTAFSQSHQIDSATALLKHAKEDTVKLNLLMYLTENADDEIWPKYNEQLLQLSTALTKHSNPAVNRCAKIKYALALNNKGLLQTEAQDFQNALTNYSLSLAIRKELNDKNGIIESYGNLAYACQKMDKFPEAITYHLKVLGIQQEMKDTAGCAATLNKIGVKYDHLGNQDKAMEFYLKSMDLCKKIGDKKTTADLLNNIALVYKNKGDINNSLKYNFESLKIKDEIHYDEGMAYTYNNLSIIYTEQGQYEKSLQYLFLGLKLADKFSKPVQKAMLLTNVGGVYQRQGLHDKALLYYKQGLAIYRSEYDNTGVAGVLNNIANIYSDQGRMEKAIAFLEQSIRIKEKTLDKSALGAGYISLGNAYYKMNDLKKAEENCLHALKIGKELGFPELIQNSANILQQVYAGFGNYSEAFAMSQLYMKMRDSILNTENKNLLLKNQLKYEYEKKSMADSLKVSLEREAHKAELSQEKQQRYTLYAGMALLLVFGGMMYNRFKITSRQKQIIEDKNKETNFQKAIIEEKQKEILDSIHYAKRIQTALLAQKDFIEKHLPDSFILFKPKDIVSGDFYWATFYENRFYLAVCDSTGHGVPGAFMSLLNIGFLSEAIKEKNIAKPNEVLDYVRNRLTESISKEGQKDGMDGVLLCIDGNSDTITYAAAHNNPVLVRNGDLKMLEYDKMPVGKGEKNDPFRLFTLEIQKGDTLYLYTDGYADQFGGPKGKKFKYKKLDELLCRITPLPFSEQAAELGKSFDEWKGNLEQVDDVLVIGIKM
jgi:serine phosphatase RsbU (regulator of sigma subunit)/tetratricopeptide (TPR) repeat protein